MADAPAPDDAEPPGKRRTLWHPILVALLEWALRDSCEVRDEVSVGRMPLRLDIVLVRRLESPIPEAAFQSLSAISRRLNAYTLIEFKSPTDALEYGDWNKLAGCAHLFLAQLGRTLRAADLTLMVVAPRLTAAFAEELAASDHALQEEEWGVHRIEGGSFAAYVIETDRLAGVGEPALTMVSHEFLDDPQRYIAELFSQYAEMVRFTVQQIEKLRASGTLYEEDAMAKVFPTLEQMEAEALERMPLEKRLKGISTQDRLQGIPAKERLVGLTAEEKKALRKQLEEESLN